MGARFQIPPRSSDFLDFGQSSQNTYRKSVFGRGLVMACLNINSLVSHIDDQRIFMSQSKGIDILAINETKLKSMLTSVRVILNALRLRSRDSDQSRSLCLLGTDRHSHLLTFSRSLRGLLIKSMLKIWNYIRWVT